MLNHAHQEKERVKVSFGSANPIDLELLTESHPFVQQVDVVFPFNSTLLGALEKPQTSYGTTKVTLPDVVAHSDTFIDQVQGTSTICLVGKSQQGDDFWCIDPRGYLSLSVSKETYERLGLAGRRMPFKGHEDRHCIDLSLKKGSHSPKNWSKITDALAKWDEHRRTQLSGGSDDGHLWDVFYCGSNCGQDLSTPTLLNLPFASGECSIHSVRCIKTELQSVHIPTFSVQDLQSRPPTSDLDALVDWSRHLHALFEWIGMACLGSQRLYANDRVDPYIALYEPPTPNYVGDVVHLRWRGVLSSSFVKKVLEIGGWHLASSQDATPFLSLSIHALTTSPVSYIPHSISTDSEKPTLVVSERVPSRVPTSDGVDTCNVILQRPSKSSIVSPTMSNWCLMEYLGPCDTRWG